MRDQRAIFLRLRQALTTWTLVMAFGHTHGFELTPLPTKAERFVASKTYGINFRLVYPAVDFALHRFSVPVHEALTHTAYECPDSVGSCTDADLDFAGTAVIAGVRWNDDPPFQFSPGSGNYPGCPKSSPNGQSRTISFALSTTCWLLHFHNVESIASKRPETYSGGNGTLLARTHFGDLQFLHSMAARLGEEATETKRRILMWFQFTWRLQTFTFDFIDPGTRMGEVTVERLSDHFPSTEQRTVSELFTVGRPWLRLHLSDLAFGSLLHVVEDSFSGGHTFRRLRSEAGCARSEIVTFHTYAGQDKERHKLADGIDEADNQTELHEVLRTLVLMRYQRKQWPEVRDYLSGCVFGLASDAQPATAEVSPPLISIGVISAQERRLD